MDLQFRYETKDRKSLRIVPHIDDKIFLRNRQIGAGPSLQIRKVAVHSGKFGPEKAAHWFSFMGIRV